MEHIAALLLIVGCSGDMKACAELLAPTPIYETMEECQADLSQSLAGARNARPVVRGACVYVDPAMEEEDAELTWDVKPDGTLVASVQAVQPDMMMTSSVKPESNTLQR